MKTVHVTTGKQDVRLTAPSHVRGVRQGNVPDRNRRRELAQLGGGQGLRARGRRSTGINPEDREPIDPEMPTLTPP